MNQVVGFWNCSNSSGSLSILLGVLLLALTQGVGLLALFGIVHLIEFLAYG